MPNVQTLPFEEIIRRRLLYLEGLADGLEDTPRRALRTWIDGTRKILNTEYPKDVDNADK